MSVLNGTAVDRKPLSSRGGNAYTQTIRLNLLKSFVTGHDLDPEWVKE